MGGRWASDRIVRTTRKRDKIQEHNTNSGLRQRQLEARPHPACHHHGASSSSCAPPCCFAAGAAAVATAVATAAPGRPAAATPLVGPAAQLVAVAAAAATAASLGWLGRFTRSYAAAHPAEQRLIVGFPFPARHED